MAFRMGITRFYVSIILGLSFGITIRVSNAQSETLTPVSGMALKSNAIPNETAKPAPNQPLTIVFALKHVNNPALEAFISSQHDPASPNFQKWLTPDAVGVKFGAPVEEVAAVQNFAAAQNLKVTVWPNRMFISAAGTVAQIQKALNVTLHGYNRTRIPGSFGLSDTYFAPEQNPTIPAQIADSVESIFGLSNFVQMRSGLQQAAGHFAAATAPVTDPIGSLFRKTSPPFVAGSGLGATPQFTNPLTPADVSKVYNFDGLHTLGLDGNGFTIGIFSPTSVADSDLQAFCSWFGFPVPNIQHFAINGGANSSSGQAEACLDGEVILGQAPKAKVVFYESPNDGSLDTWNQIAAQNAAVISNSWSIDDYYMHNNGLDNYVASWHTILATMDAQGMAHFNSSGDDGSHNYISSVNSVGFPGSDTHVTCVGGTSLTGDANGNYKSETGWNGSGGGLSLYFPRPSWQAGPGVVNAQSNGMRQTPDISAIADPNTPGFYVYTLGGWYQYGGTSASTPLWSVADLLMTQRLSTLLGNGHRTGLLNVPIYAMEAAYNGATGFFFQHDSTAGSNGAYACTAGWDFVTGWGSADFTKFTLDYLENYQNQAAVDLAPFNPAVNGFNSPIMIHKVQNVLTEPSTFATTDTYYITLCISNSGSADSLPNNQSLRIDGVDNKFLMGPFAGSGNYYYVTPFTKSFSAGSHTIALVANVDSTVKETSSANNTFSRTINVVNPNGKPPASGAPRLPRQPVQP